MKIFFLNGLFNFIAIIGFSVSGAAELSPNGLKFEAPQVSGKTNVASPQNGEIVWDSSDGYFWGYSNSSWLNLSSISQWQKSGSHIYYSSGNVGIGTSSPSYLLDVVGGDIRINQLTLGRGSGGNQYSAALGLGALQANTTGGYNVAIGAFTLYGNTTGEGNTATGYNSLRSNTTGQFNVAVGASSLNSNTTGAGNVALGSEPLYYNTSGGGNVAIGANALAANTVASYSVAIGESALRDSAITTAFTSAHNTAIGYNTGRGIVTGTNNTIIGANVSGLSSSLSNNIIIADGSGNQRINIASTGNVGLGVSTPTTKLQVAGIITSSSDGIYDLGTSGLRFKDIYATNGTIQTSDLREKKDIQDSDLGLNFITKLRPVSYKWKTGDSDMHYGLIAQEAEQAITQTGSQNHPATSIISLNRESGRYGIRYTELIAPIIKAVQELNSSCTYRHNEYVALKAANMEIQIRNTELTARIEKLEKLIESQIEKN